MLGLVQKSVKSPRPMASPTEQPATSEEKISFNVKSASGASYPLSLLTTATVAEIKQELSTLANIAPEDQQLLFQGSKLELDEQTLASLSTCSYNFKNWDKIFVILLSNG